MKKYYILFLVILSAVMYAEKSPTKIKPSKVIDYCTPQVSDPEALTLVSFGAINNRTSSTTNVGYEDFTSKSTNVGIFRTYEIKLQANTEGKYYASFTVFIDFNQDGLLGPINSLDEEGAKERFEVGYIYDSNGNDGKEITATITVPGTAVLGTTRMRVMKRQTTLVPIVYATSGCDLGNTYGQVEDYSINVFAPQGCDTAPNGANITSYFLPKNDNQYHVATSAAKTGGYTDVFVFEGANYDFKIGKEGIFSTFKSLDGSTIRTSSVSEFSWKSNFTGIVRWFTHTDELSCGVDNSVFSEEVQAGTITNPIKDGCNVGIPDVTGYFTMDNGGSNNQELAIDIPMRAGKFSTIKGISINMGDASFVNFEDLNDANGLPGSLISTIHGTIDSKVLAYTKDGKDIYNYKITFDKPVLTDGTFFLQKWLKIVTDAQYVEVNPSLKISQNVAVKNSTNGSWQLDDIYEVVYQMEAECRQEMCTQVVISPDDPTDDFFEGNMGYFTPNVVTSIIDMDVNPNDNLKVNGIEIEMMTYTPTADIDLPKMMEFSLRKHDSVLQQPGEVILEKIPHTSTRERMEIFVPDPETDQIMVRWKVKVMFDEALVLDGTQATKYWLEVNSDYLGYESTNDTFSFVGYPVYYNIFNTSWAVPGFEMVYKLLTDCMVLETQNPIKQEKTKIYPIPFANTLNISAAATIKNIEIFNMSGAKAYQKDTNDSKVKLDLSQLPVGVYVVKTTDINGNVDSQKIIKK